MPNITRASTKTTALQFVFQFSLAMLFVAGLASCSRNPMGTGLPMDLADIHKIQPQLDKLTAVDRDLVLGYLKRSKGDVLPVQFADPDQPFTARTFAEAIKLQREFLAKQVVEDARMGSLREAREAGMEPLRMALSVELVKREIVTSDEATGREARQGQALNTTPVLMTTWRLTNFADDTITHVSGSATVRTTSEPSSLMGVASCYINRIEPITIGDIVEIRCGNANKSVGEAERDFVAMPYSSLVVTWEPKSIALAGGKVLKASADIATQ